MRMSNMTPILALKEDALVLIQTESIFKCEQMIKRRSSRVSWRPAIMESQSIKLPNIGDK